MFIRVLGAAAGGGYPQWNCNHPNSRLARNKDFNAIKRTQSSIAVSLDKKKWVEELNNKFTLIRDPK